MEFTCSCAQVSEGFDPKDSRSCMAFRGMESATFSFYVCQLVTPITKLTLIYEYLCKVLELISRLYRDELCIKPVRCSATFLIYWIALLISDLMMFQYFSFLYSFD